MNDLEINLLLYNYNNFVVFFLKQGMNFKVFTQLIFVINHFRLELTLGSECMDTEPETEKRNSNLTEKK
jgi:hypothetical protein